MYNTSSSYSAIVIGVSAGGLSALTTLLSPLPAYYPVPLIIVQHRSQDQSELLEEVLQTRCAIKIKQADEKEMVKGGIAYFAPPGYHLLIEGDHTFSLSSEEYDAHSRPSIDVLFESAAEVYGQRLVGIILTGANSDGAAGTTRIREQGGLTIAQDPQEAPYPTMPEAAISKGVITFIWSLSEIKKFIMELPLRDR